MIGRVIALVILVAVLFFPAKMLWNHFMGDKQANSQTNGSTMSIVSDTSNTGLAAHRAALDVQKETEKKASKQKEKGKKTKVAKSSQKQGPKGARKYTFWNSLQDLVGLGPNSDRFHQNTLAAIRKKPMAERLATIDAAKEVINYVPEFEESHMVTDTGTTPAQNIIAKVASPVKHLSYELNQVQPLPQGRMRVVWKIKNDSGKTIFLNNTNRHKLSPGSLKVMDFSYQNAMQILWYPDNRPIANCLLTDRIPPFGRISCSALVGPRFDGNEAVMSGKVRVKLPGVKNTFDVYLHV